MRAAVQRAEESGFELSCEPAVGALLAALAASVPEQGRILELGTGVGVGLAWLTHGLSTRDDVSVTSVDLDPAIQAIARRCAWPGYVRFELGDGTELLPALGNFDLVFADAPGGKLHGLDRSIASLSPRGILIVDDMDLSRHNDPELCDALAHVRQALLASPDLLSVELSLGSGVMLCVRR